MRTHLSMHTLGYELVLSLSTSSYMYALLRRVSSSPLVLRGHGLPMDEVRPVLFVLRLCHPQRVEIPEAGEQSGTVPDFVGPDPRVVRIGHGHLGLEYM